MTLTQFLGREKAFFTSSFPKTFYEKLLSKLLADSKERLLNDFLYGLPLDSQEEVFDFVFLPMLEYLSTESLPLETTFYPFMKDLFMQLSGSYKQQFDNGVTEAFKVLQENGGWDSRLLALAERLVANAVQIGLCYEL